MIVEYLNQDFSVDVTDRSNLSILEVVQSLGLPVGAACSGKQKCGKCLIFVKGLSSFAQKKELDLLQKKIVPTIPDGYEIRLACFTKAEANARVILPDFESTIESFSDTKPLTDQPLAVGIDVGTTTVTVSLVSTTDNKILSQKTEYNNQRLYGSDVLSRIQFDNENPGQLTKVLTEQLDSIILELATSDFVQNVNQVVVAGNTTMMHFLCGLPTESLGVAPFTPLSLFGFARKSNDIFSCLSPNTRIFIPNCLSSFVGADITAGMLDREMFESNKKLLLVDIGTNGEMVLLNDGVYYTTSTAAGPVFEGAEISHGSLAVDGAISCVSLDEGLVRSKTINNKEAIGICGSGVISAVSQMLQNGLITETGELNEESSSFADRMIQGDLGCEFKITEKITVTQSDIRKIQLAKSAIRAGIETLLHEAGLEIDELDSLIIAGGFGQHVAVADMFTIGMIPTFPQEKIVLAGNTSLQGVIKVLFQSELERFLTSESIDNKPVDLAQSRYFNEKYIDFMWF